MGADEAIWLERIDVGPGRLEAELRMLPEWRFTTPELVARVEQSCPTIGAHTCVNSKGPSFSCVMNRTSLAHLVEHVAIDLQVRAECGELSGLGTCAPDGSAGVPGSDTLASAAPAPGSGMLASAAPASAAPVPAAPASAFTYVGTTEWLDERAGRARVALNFSDDLVALRCLRDALRIVNEAVVR